MVQKLNELICECILIGVGIMVMFISFSKGSWGWFSLFFVLFSALSFFAWFDYETIKAKWRMQVGWD